MKWLTWNSSWIEVESYSWCFIHIHNSIESIELIHLYRNVRIPDISLVFMRVSYQIQSIHLNHHCLQILKSIRWWLLFIRLSNERSYVKMMNNGDVRSMIRIQFDDCYVVPSWIIGDDGNEVTIDEFRDVSHLIVECDIE